MHFVSEYEKELLEKYRFWIGIVAVVVAIVCWIAFYVFFVEDSGYTIVEGVDENRAYAPGEWPQVEEGIAGIIYATLGIAWTVLSISLLLAKPWAYGLGLILTSAQFVALLFGHKWLFPRHGGEPLMFLVWVAFGLIFVCLGAIAQSRTRLKKSSPTIKEHDQRQNPSDT